MNKFIITKDETTKIKLLKMGYKLISDNNCVFVFENNTAINFSEKQDLKVIHTNTLFI